MNSTYPQIKFLTFTDILCIEIRCKYFVKVHSFFAFFRVFHFLRKKLCSSLSICFWDYLASICFLQFCAASNNYRFVFGINLNPFVQFCSRSYNRKSYLLSRKDLNFIGQQVMKKSHLSATLVSWQCVPTRGLFLTFSYFEVIKRQ